MEFMPHDRRGTEDNWLDLATGIVDLQLALLVRAINEFVQSNETEVRGRWDIVWRQLWTCSARLSELVSIAGKTSQRDRAARAFVTAAMPLHAVRAKAELTRAESGLIDQILKTSETLCAEFALEVDAAVWLETWLRVPRVPQHHGTAP